MEAYIPPNITDLYFSGRFVPSVFPEIPSLSYFLRIVPCCWNEVRAILKLKQSRQQARGQSECSKLFRAFPHCRIILRYLSSTSNGRCQRRLWEKAAWREKTERKLQTMTFRLSLRMATAMNTAPRRFFCRPFKRISILGSYRSIFQARQTMLDAAVLHLFPLCWTIGSCQAWPAYGMPIEL